MFLKIITQNFETDYKATRRPYQIHTAAILVLFELCGKTLKL
jgi:hypothetical protein